MLVEHTIRGSVTQLRTLVHERLNIMDSKSRTQTLSVSLLFTQDTRVQLILCNGMLNQL